MLIIKLFDIIQDPRFSFSKMLIFAIMAAVKFKKASCIGIQLLYIFIEIKETNVMNSLQCAAICLITRKSGYSMGNLFCGSLPFLFLVVGMGIAAAAERGDGV